MRLDELPNKRFDKGDLQSKWENEILATTYVVLISLTVLKRIKKQDPHFQEYVVKSNQNLEVI